jgi:GAF domain-containing protein
LEGLQRVSVELARALSPAEVADVIVRRAAIVLGGNTGSLCSILPDGETFELVREVGLSEDVGQRWQRFPVAAPMPAGDAVRARRPLILRSLAERDERYPMFAGVPTKSRSFAVLPLLVDDQPLGVFTIGFSTERVFDADDLAFLESLAALCAQSLHRAQLHDAAQRSADRLSFLAEASRALASSLDYHRTLAQVAKLVVPRLAELCAVIVRAPDDTLQVVAVEATDAAMTSRAREWLEAHPQGLSAQGGIGAALRTGRPQWHPHVTPDMVAQGVADSRERDAIAAVGLTSAAVVPLTARGRTLGVVTLATTGGRQMTGEDFALVQDLAGRAAVAVDNARLYDDQVTIARSLQDSLLPPALPQIPGVDLAARYLSASPGAEVGGDFYDVAEIVPNRWLIAIGDVCGKGVSAARHTSLVRHAIRSAAVTFSSPADILRHVNDVVANLEAPGTAAADRALCTACVVMLDVDRPGGAEAVVAAGGHPLPLLVLPGAPPAEVGTPGTLLGAFPSVEIEEQKIVLPALSALVLYTDGFIERRQGSRFFGLDRLIAALRGSPVSAEAIADGLVDAAMRFTSDKPGDDMAVVVVRPAGSS